MTLSTEKDFCGKLAVQTHGKVFLHHAAATGSETKMKKLQYTVYFNTPAFLRDTWEKGYWPMSSDQGGQGE